MQSVSVDGVLLDPTLITPIAGSDYYFANLPLPLGSHVLNGDEPFGLTLYGYDSYNSYGYIGGLALGAESVVAGLTVDTHAPSPVYT